MLSNQMKWQDITPPPCFCFLQLYWKIPSDKTESCLVKRVNTWKRCWYHSQWYNNHFTIKWNGARCHPSACLCFPHRYWKMPSNKPASHFVKWVNICEECWYHSQQDHDPSLTPSNQITWQVIIHPPSSFCCNDNEGCPVTNLNIVLSIESTGVKDVCTMVDKTTVSV